jgi:hypothetical protein
MSRISCAGDVRIYNEHESSEKAIQWIITLNSRDIHIYEDSQLLHIHHAVSSFDCHGACYFTNWTTRDKYVHFEWVLSIYSILPQTSCFKWHITPDQLLFISTCFINFYIISCHSFLYKWISTWITSTVKLGDANFFTAANFQGCYLVTRTPRYIATIKPTLKKKLDGR